MRPILFIYAILFLFQFFISTPETKAQKTKPETFSFSVRSQLVEIYMTVTKDNHLIPGMAASDFQLAEDGTSVLIDRLDSQDVPLQIALLFDISESVSPNLRYIKEAATAFIDSLHPSDRVTLIFFNSEINVFPQTTDDRKIISQEIRKAQAAGATRLHDALLRGMKELDGKPGRKAIVCFTDGEDTSGTSLRTTVMNAARQYGYPVYAIGAGAGLEMDSLKTILCDFAEINSGKAFFIQNIRKLRKAFEEVALELHSAYVLHYYTQIPPDGKWHELSIQSINPAFEVHSRKGFLAVPKDIR